MTQLLCCKYTGKKPGSWFTRWYNIFLVVGHLLFYFYWASKVKKDIEQSNIFLSLAINIDIGNFEAEDWIGLYRSYTGPTYRVSLKTVNYILSSSYFLAFVAPPIKSCQSIQKSKLSYPILWYKWNRGKFLKIRQIYFKIWGWLHAQKPQFPLLVENNIST